MNNLADLSDALVNYNDKTFRLIEVFSTGYMLVIEHNATFPAQPVVIPNVHSLEVINERKN